MAAIVPQQLDQGVGRQNQNRQVEQCHFLGFQGGMYVC